MNPVNTDYDIIIIGAGMVGATLACLLAKSHYRIAVFERATPPAFDPNALADLRVSAISRHSQNALQSAGAWSMMETMRIAPYERMFVWDGTGDGEIEFDAAKMGEPNLGHIIENQVIQLALIEAIEQYSNIDLICPIQLNNITIKEETATIDTDQQSYQCKLVIGADGAHSLVRRLVNINHSENDYAQKGLVATIETEQGHQSTAWQRFMPTGPLAVLPLASPKQSSIVWTLPADKADYLLAMDEAQFNEELSTAFDHKLGQMKILSQRAAFPLMGRHAEQYINHHVALIGDAAHTIHPLAGQGVNLGIKDAVELAKTIQQSSKALGGYSQLREYERARKGDNHLTQKAMEGLNMLFSHSLPLVSQGRNYGLKLLNSFSPIKNQIIRHAMGLGR
ncbi:MAG: UbiH/UbiF/VisC/COQ6 family ubiquinone biosynthesis hydroxylase [Thiotrichaceae bacterium]|nr:UbiH/UbiF/VisC/COQ6 family ubiquinone biosynthesis hydroxylase [Thiotrichaceae bacterium]